jgi:hypothetical protein
VADADPHPGRAARQFRYAGETLLAAPYQVARDRRAGTTLRDPGLAKWLVCNQDECIPGSATLTLSLPSAGARTVDRHVASSSDDARRCRSRRHPRGGSRREPNGDGVALVVQGAGATAERSQRSPFFFAADREALEPSAPQP